MFKQLGVIAALVAAANAQAVCTLTTETKPNLGWSRCTASGCSDVQGKIVIDSNWRWTHSVDSSDNCYDGNEWDTTLCKDGVSCAKTCCVDGADYSGTYGITTSGKSLDLKYVTTHAYGKNIGSRVYLMENESKYQMFTLLGNEFTFDVDMSNVPCGLNGALYFVSMDADGGLSKFSGNNAGAKYGTGYCDAQCPRDLKWIAGKANVEGWDASSTDSNVGVGNLGACCTEMDIWEANSRATAVTPHTCDTVGYSACTGDGCGGTYSGTRYAGTCDPDGCDFNSWRQGNRTFYGTGSGFKLDTTKKMTVVTQFIKGTNGALSEIRRLYVQNGVVIQNSQSTIAGNTGDSLTKQFCDTQKAAFSDPDPFNNHGGWSQMSKALAEPMVLVMSLWDDGYANMLWLDSTYPVGATKPGASRGPCSTSSGVPDQLREQVPNSSVAFSNIKFGPIGSTYSGGTGNPPPSSTTTSRPPTTTTTTPGGGGTVPRWGQCGGQGWTGATACQSPYTCQKLNDWYSQCL